MKAIMLHQLKLLLEDTAVICFYWRWNVPAWNFILYSKDDSRI